MSERTISTILTLKLVHFNLYCNEMGSHWSACFIVPVIRSVLAWWWPTYGRNM